MAMQSWRHMCVQYIYKTRFLEEPSTKDVMITYERYAWIIKTKYILYCSSLCTQFDADASHLSYEARLSMIRKRLPNQCENVRPGEQEETRVFKFMDA